MIIFISNSHFDIKGDQSDWLDQTGDIRWRILRTQSKVTSPPEKVPNEKAGS